jgi:formamidase
MKSITINRSLRLVEEPGTGHNRWHPDIEPLIAADEGEEVVLETRDASDGKIVYGGSASAVGPNKAVHPLTGPVWVNGAEPGDLLEVEYLEIRPESWGYTRFSSAGGFLSDIFTTPYMVHWDIKDGWATSPKLPGVHIPDGAFMGTAGVAPSREQLIAWSKREADLVARGGRAQLPDPEDAVPGIEHIAREGLRTAPPRENGGNADVKQLTKGSRLYLPVAVPGALYSAGDAHFAQGDGEACITAIEMSATVSVRFKLHKGEAAAKNIRWPRFAHPDYFLPAEWAAPRNFIATMGMPVREDGTQEPGDLNLATRNALLNMIDLLEERGWTREQAYIICSVAVDLRLSNVVDLPNVTVSAFLPENIFTERA